MYIAQVRLGIESEPLNMMKLVSVMDVRTQEQADMKFDIVM